MLNYNYISLFCLSDKNCVSLSNIQLKILLLGLFHSKNEYTFQFLY